MYNASQVVPLARYDGRRRPHSLLQSLGQVSSAGEVLQAARGPTAPGPGASASSARYKPKPGSVFGSVSMGASRRARCQRHSYVRQSGHAASDSPHREASAGLGART
jgi:hypothetical protein